eukprot:133471-Pyramimonas_sp.AAC.1
MKGCLRYAEHVIPSSFCLPRPQKRSGEGLCSCWGTILHSLQLGGSLIISIEAEEEDEER